MLPLFNSLTFGFGICLWDQNMKSINMSEKRLLLGRENATMGYSAAYPMGRELGIKAEGICF
jgi:hypothetical protein